MNVPLLSRCLQLVSLLYSQAAYSAPELASQLGVSGRTIYRYFDVLREVGIPVHFDRRKGGYVVAPAYRLKVPHLTSEELSLLMLAAHSSPLSHSGKLGQAVTLAISKLLAQIPAELRAEATTLLRSCQVGSQVDLLLPNEHDLCLQLLAALRHQRQIRITYRSGDTPETHVQTKVAPYQLVLVPEDAHLVGRSSWHRKVWTIPLRQIVHAEITDDTYLMPPHYLTAKSRLRSKGHGRPCAEGEQRESPEPPLGDEAE